jgi:hypothetical protein
MIQSTILSKKCCFLLIYKIKAENFYPSQLFYSRICTPSAWRSLICSKSHSFFDYFSFILEWSVTYHGIFLYDQFHDISILKSLLRYFNDIPGTNLRTFFYFRLYHIYALFDLQPPLFNRKKKKKRGEKNKNKTKEKKTSQQTYTHFLAIHVVIAKVCILNHPPPHPPCTIIIILFAPMLAPCTRACTF